MDKNHTTPADSGQDSRVSDYLKYRLRDERPILPEVLLKLAPPEPLVEPDRSQLRHLTDAEFRDELTEDKALRQKFPGYQSDCHFREHMKYGRRPPEDAPSREQVRQVLYHAMAKWSVEVQFGRTNKQFIDWIPIYLESDLCWRIDQLAEALQILRLAYGLPRFDPWRKASR